MIPGKIFEQASEAAGATEVDLTLRDAATDLSDE